MTENKTVLLVEDDEDIVALIEMLLSGEGYRVEVARNGQDALESIRRQVPGVVLLDLTLPGMSGWDVAERIKSEYGSASPPIVILSAGRDLEEKARQVGADDLLSKPFEVDDLVETVKKWTSRRSRPSLRT